MTEIEIPKHLYWIPRERQEESVKPADMRPDSEEWTSQDLHLFVVTDVGKPVYFRYGTAKTISPILCTCVVILEHMKSMDENLNHFRAGDHIFVFLPKRPFIFIAVSRNSLPVSYLYKQLNFLYCLFLSLFSAKFINTISENPSCDFRQYAEGTKSAWDGVVNNMSEDPAFIFSPAIPVGHLKSELRQQFLHSLNQEKLPSCKLIMLMKKNRVLAVSHVNCDPLSLRLIVDLMWTPAFQNEESWAVFFTRGSTDGMHHLYFKSNSKTDIKLVMLSGSSQGFDLYHQFAVNIFKDFNQNYLEEISKPLVYSPTVFYCWALYSITYGQVYITDPDPHYFCSIDVDASPADLKEMQKSAKEKMQQFYIQLAKSCEMVETNDVDGEYMFRGDNEVIIAYKSKEMEIYAIAKSELLSDAQITEQFGQLKQFISSHFNELTITDTKFHLDKFD